MFFSCGSGGGGVSNGLALVLVFIHSNAIVFIAPKATDNASSATIASHNAHTAPSVGFPYYINYRHKDDVMI